MEDRENQATVEKNRIQVEVVGQEGDVKPIETNLHEPISTLLREGLHALYGEPGPNPNDYDVVVDGKWVEPLSLKIVDVGIADGTLVSILPKSVSRG